MDTPMLDKCPGWNLYIGGFIALRRKQALLNCGITHVVSVLDWQFEDDSPLIQGFGHFHIPVDDVEDENLLEWFPRSNVFIHEALKPGRQKVPATLKSQPGEKSAVSKSGKEPAVLIHCAMGKSRSATVLLAYLLWESRQSNLQSSGSSNPNAGNDSDMIQLPRKPLSVIEALTLLRRGRPIAEPNEGFMDQLYLYTDMGCPTTQQQLESHKLYRRWMNKRNVEESLRINRAPDMVDIRFEDEEDEDGNEVSTSSTKQNTETHMEPAAPGVSAPDGTSNSPRANSLAVTSSQSTETQIKCRKCRRLLAKSAFIIPHKPPPHRDPSPSSSSCAHIFLHPLSWMKETLSEGQLDGRLTCPNPKCGANIGKFAWQGLRCSCGGWVTPGFGVARARVDEITIPAKEQGLAKGDETLLPIRGSSMPGGGAIRLPPGMRKEHL